MSTVREYRMPLLVAGGALVVAIILWVVLIAPQNSKLASLQAQQSQLQGQEQQLQARLAALQSEGQKLSANCADLQKISTQIPSVQSPTDIDAEESSFEDQFNQLASTSGVTLAQFSGFSPATGASASATTATPTATPTTTAGVTAVPTTLTVQGNYGQITAFVNGLDSFPRLFVIQKFILAIGNSTTAGASTSGATPAAANTTALWVGGQATPASAGPYNLQITGSIYYTSTPNALSTCTKATAAQSSLK
jgi:Tfp pilus assembly protein PilO